MPRYYLDLYTMQELSYLGKIVLVSIWFRACSHGVTSPKSQVTWGSSKQSQPLRAWKLGLTTAHKVGSPKYDMDAYMATLFGGEAWDLCWELGQAKS